jgi:ATP-dependent RNA helicase DeaD
MVDELSSRLGERGYAAEGLHGDISQAGREIILGKFRKKKITILVATDVAARGIDVQNLSHVINYSLPQEVDSYIHRIGRTGRAGKEGTAVTFVTPSEYRKLLFLKRMTRSDIRKERVPGIDEVIGAKKNRILSVIKAKISKGENTDFRAMAEELLSEGDPADVLSAVLSHSLRDKLDSSKYEKIRDLGDTSVDRTGKARLSIRMGRRDGATKRLIVDLIEKESAVPGRLVREVDVFDGHSFVSVPFHEAEIILKSFQKKDRGTRPFVEIDKGRRPTGARFERPRFERPRFDSPRPDKPQVRKPSSDKPWFEGHGEFKKKKKKKQD